MPMRKSILDWGDNLLVCADYKAYCEMHRKVGETFLDKAKWAKMAILNTARMGKFSSDRTIKEYAEDIWHLS
jgi:starch phosphorylase